MPYQIIYSALYFACLILNRVSCKNTKKTPFEFRKIENST